MFYSFTIKDLAKMQRNSKILHLSYTQFEIIDARTIALNDKQKNKNTYLIKDADGVINGKPTYARICIKKVS